MATRKTAPVVEQEEEVLVRVVDEDPWKVERDIIIPRDGSNETSEWVCVNGRSYQVPKGKRVTVPAPVAEVIENTLAMQERARSEKERLEKIGEK